MRVFRGRLSYFVFVLFFPFGIESRMWGVIVLIPDHCHSIYFLDIFDLVKTRFSFVCCLVILVLTWCFSFGPVFSGIV